MEWVRGDIIGRGSFSTVNFATQKKNRSQSPHPPRLMAVKSSGFPQSDMLLREKSVLEELSDCPQIIRCFGGDWSAENGEKLYNLFLEYADGGTLADKMKHSNDRRLPESEVRRHTTSVLEGLKHMHRKGFVHCDLKLQNILLCSSKDTPNYVAKIADFGLARRAGARREEVGVELRGTPLYMSPEAVSDGEQEAPADLWALGCLVVEMVSGAPAWRCSPEFGVLRLLMRIGASNDTPALPVDLSAEGKDFLSKCFVRDPAKRWTAEMLLEHPFVADGRPCEASPSTSPRGPLDWEETDSVRSAESITKIPLPEYSSTWSCMQFDSCGTGSSSIFSAADRIRQLVTCQGHDCLFMDDSWVSVR